MTEGEIVGWHHGLHGHESEQTPGDNEGQGSPVSCSPWDCKDWDMTSRLNNNKKIHLYMLANDCYNKSS